MYLTVEVLTRWSLRDDDTDFDNVMIEIDENGLPRRDRLVLKRAENDRLEKQRKFLENEIRRKTPK